MGTVMKRRVGLAIALACAVGCGLRLSKHPEGWTGKGDEPGKAGTATTAPGKKDAPTPTEPALALAPPVEERTYGAKVNRGGGRASGRRTEAAEPAPSGGVTTLTRPDGTDDGDAMHVR